MSLSERVRSNSEVAPWVLPEIIKLENQNAILCEALEEIEEKIPVNILELYGFCPGALRKTISKTKRERASAL